METTRNTQTEVRNGSIVIGKVVVTDTGDIYAYTRHSTTNGLFEFIGCGYDTVTKAECVIARDYARRTRNT